MFESNLPQQDLPTLAVVIPCYNEEAIIALTATTISTQIQKLVDKGLLSNHSYISFIDDGSHDQTWSLIDNLCQNNNKIRGIKLSKNYGHQIALLSGLIDNKDSDLVVTIDADLQHDIEVLEEMITRIKNGAKIVYGVRKNRNSKSHFKNKFSELFYSIMKSMGVELIHNHADFRMCTRQVIEELSNHNEVHVFLRGIFPSMGFTSDVVYFTEQERKYGASKYSSKKMINLAINGITSFSIAPLRLILWIGLIVFFISIILILYALFTWLYGYTTRGWTSMLILISFMGGIQLLSIGVMGEYLGRVYHETKRRPRYIVEDRRRKSHGS